MQLVPVKQQPTKPIKSSIKSFNMGDICGEYLVSALKLLC
jgi:hypothetical protein